MDHQHRHPDRRRTPRATQVATAVLLAACTTSNAATDDSLSATTGAAVAAASSRADTAATARVALPVVTELARTGDLVIRIATTGQMRSDAAVKVRAEVGGTVAELLVRPGAQVTRGQPLLRLDPYPFDLAVREAQAAVDQAEQQYFELYLPDSLVTGRAPSAAQRRALMNRTGLAGARLRLERARFEQSRAVIASPVDGMIDVVDVSPGERVTGGQPLLTAVDTHHLRIEAQVLEHDLPLLRVGGDARVTSAGAPLRVLHGRIDAVLPLVDSITRAGRAVVRISGDGALRPGMYADVELEAARLERRLLVPTRAVIERDGRPLVFVVRDGRAQWTYITPGRSNGTETEVLPDSVSGARPLAPGDPVIVDGHLTLTHDAPVSIRAPAAPRR